MTPAPSPENPDWYVTTLAGGPMPGFQDGTAVEARFHEPSAIATLPDGRFLVLEAGNARLRLVSPDGTTRTVPATEAPAEAAHWLDGGYMVGTREEPLPIPEREHPAVGRPRPWRVPAGLAVGADGEWVVADTGEDRLWAVSPDGRARWMAGAAHPGFYVGAEKTTLFERDGAVVFSSSREALVAQSWRDGSLSTARFNSPAGVVMRPDGTLVVADTGNGCLRLVFSGGEVATMQTYSDDPALDGYPLRVAGSGGLPSPVGLAVGCDGTLFVSDSRAHRILAVASTGAVSVYAGCGEPGLADGAANTAAFREPAGLALDHAGGLWVADAGNHAIRYIAPDGTVKTIAGTGEPGHRDGLGPCARFERPWGIGVTPQGTVVIADRRNHLIRQVSLLPAPSLEPDECGFLYSTEAASGQQGDRPPSPVRLTAWQQCVGREVRAVVQDYANDAVRIYFRDAWAEFEGVGRLDPIPYFFYDEDGADFHLDGSHLAGKRVLALRLGPSGQYLVGPTDEDEPERAFGYVEWAAFDFDDGTTEWLRSYAGEGVRFIEGDAGRR